jgi:Family of unknown function (DUF6886)
VTLPGVPAVVHHLSEDPSIRRFRPHVPPTNPTHRPAVWAIDTDHAPLYWFPRDCPRVTAWPRPTDDPEMFAEAWVTTARRVHAVELGWLDRMRTTTLYRYDFAASGFEPWPDAAGQWIAEHEIAPIAVVELTDLLGLHADAGIELRLVPSLWPLRDLAVDDRWEFSLVRMANASPRHPSV